MTAIDQHSQGFRHWFIHAVKVILVVILAALIMFYPYVFAWLSINDPTPDKRLAYLNDVLNQCCVSARLGTGAMITLRRDDIKDIGESRCTREYHCASSGRYCTRADVTWYCTYNIRNRADAPGTAILKAPPNNFYDPLADQYSAWRREPYTPQRLVPDEAQQQLCRLGYCR